MLSSVDDTIASPVAAWQPNGERLSVIWSPTAHAAETFWTVVCTGRQSPLVAAALPLLNLCVRLKPSSSHAEVEGLRLRVLREIDAFERRIAPSGYPPRIVRASKYALCATIDDLVLNTPWGSRSVWTARSMVSSLFNETWGGDRFFELLTQLKKDPGINVDVLELMYYCISLGFEGRYRVALRGAAELIVIREDLFRLIRVARGEYERDLSPRWRGVMRERHWKNGPISTWILAGLFVLLLITLGEFLGYLLGDRVDDLIGRLGALPPSGAVTIVRPQAVSQGSVTVVQAERLRRFLEPEIREGLVTVKEDDRTITVLIRGAGMFDSAQADVLPSFKPLLYRIGLALNDQPGSVVVTGYTDGTPIHTPIFPSNLELSVARAKDVTTLIQSKMQEPNRVSVQGRGEAQPIAPNDTSDNKKLNRRTEIVITKRPEVSE